MSVSIQHLRAFIEVSERLNFTRASETLNISQPAITRSIRQLEEQLDIALFERSTRSVALTREGLELLPLARRLVRDFDQALTEMREFGERHRGQVAVACPEGVAVRVMAPVARRFTRLYPGIKVTLLDGDASSVRRAMHSAEADLGVTGYWQEAPGFDVEYFIEDHCCLVCPRDHVLAKLGRPVLADLQEVPFLAMSRDTGIRMLLDRATVQQDVTLNVLFEISRLSTLFGLVEAHLGITVLPKLAVPAHHPELAVRPLAGPGMTYPIGVISPRRRALSPAAQSFREAILEHFR